MRADNHQAVAPQIISVFSKNVKYDCEGTGLGWKTVLVVPAKDVYLPTTCNMQRPQKNKDQLNYLTYSLKIN